MRKVMDNVMENSKCFRLILVRWDEYQVFNGKPILLVNLKNKKCSYS
jgi:hypothetical protein